jgi:hypothetical protein
LQLFAKEARIMYALHIVELENDWLRVEENAKVTNTMILGIGQEANDGSVFSLVVGH